MRTPTRVAVDLTADLAPSLADPPGDVLLLVFPGTPQHQTLAVDEFEVAIFHPLMVAFAVLQHHWEAIAEANGGGRVVVLAPAAAAMGDPDRPLDAAVVGGLISFVRSVAIELQRHHATANIVFFDRSPDEPAPQAMITTLLDEASSSVTGQEIYVTGGSTLGRLHP